MVGRNLVLKYFLLNMVEKKITWSLHLSLGNCMSCYWHIGLLLAFLFLLSVLFFPFYIYFLIFKKLISYLKWSFSRVNVVVQCHGFKNLTSINHIYVQSLPAICRDTLSEVFYCASSQSILPSQMTTDLITLVSDWHTNFLFKNFIQM